MDNVKEKEDKAVPISIEELEEIKIDLLKRLESKDKITDENE